MTTGRRKRLPKPTKTWQVQALIDLVPFLNADPETLLPTAKAWLNKYAITPGRWEGKLWNTTDDLSLESLESIRENLKRFMKPAYGLPITITRTIEEWTTEASSGITEEFQLRSDAIFSTWIPRNRGTGWQIRLFKGLATLAIKDSLGCNLAFLHGDVEKQQANLCAGRAYVGICPRCGKVFVKPRMNAEFCGKTCADTTSKQRQRKRLSAD